MRKVIKIICVLLCMVCIFLFSNDEGDASTQKSDGVMIWTCSIFKNHDECVSYREKYVDPYVHFVRKLAHFLIYFLLGFLLISTVSEYRVMDYKAIIIAFIIATLYACSDELHQMFVAGRSTEVFDVLLDSIGSFVGIYFYSMFYKWRRKV